VAPPRSAGRDNAGGVGVEFGLAAAVEGGIGESSMTPGRPMAASGVGVSSLTADAVGVGLAPSLPIRGVMRGVGVVMMGVRGVGNSETVGAGAPGAETDAHEVPRGTGWRVGQGVGGTGVTAGVGVGLLMDNSPGATENGVGGRGGPAATASDGSASTVTPSRGRSMPQS